MNKISIMQYIAQNIVPDRIKNVINQPIVFVYKIILTVIFLI